MQPRETGAKEGPFTLVGGARRGYLSHARAGKSPRLPGIDRSVFPKELKRPTSNDSEEPPMLAPSYKVSESPADLVRRALDEFERPLLGYANSILNDVESARDAVQDTFLRLYQQPAGAVGDGLKSWLFTVCRNRCFDMLRKRRRVSSTQIEDLDPMDESVPDPMESAAQEEAVSDVMRFLERLPHNQREVIRLKFQQGLSYKEISDITGLSVSNVGFLLHTGLKRLRLLLNHLVSPDES